MLQGVVPLFLHCGQHKQPVKRIRPVAFIILSSSMLPIINTTFNIFLSTYKIAPLSYMFYTPNKKKCKLHVLLSLFFNELKVFFNRKLGTDFLKY